MTTSTKVPTAHVPVPLRDRLTMAALEDVDAGHVIDHQAVQAWAESLSTSQPLAVPN